MHFTPNNDLFSRLPISDSAKADLSRRMEEPWRRYHTPHHLALLWDRHQQYRLADGAPETRFDTAIALAIAFHDAVYVGGAKRQRGKIGRTLAGGERRRERLR